MGFDEDWAGIRSGAPARTHGATGPAGTDPGGATGPAGGAPDLATAPAKKKAAAHTIESELEPRTGKAARCADAATAEAVAGFDGWATASGLKTVEATWDKQVRTLLARLATERDALRGTAVAFGRQELDTRTRIAGVGPSSCIDRY
ncbi:hypothetical protein ABZZ37_13630 [Streptomyces sp. NPDC006464]|uniref:hypothetical protein n=1 Tax=Streptomyces sp. NPDC006464 TaxID=3154305 RepID=UPI0033AEE7BD